MKRLISILMVLAMLLSAVTVLAEEGDLKGITYILHTNDVHGHAVASDGAWGYQAVA